MNTKNQLLRRVVVHFNYVLVWLQLVLAISDYWVQSDGSQYLPEDWILFSQKLEKNYDGWIVLLGISCSTLLGYQSLSNSVPYLWELNIAVLWSVLKLLTVLMLYDLRLLVIATLSVVVSCQIISRFVKRQTKLLTERLDVISKVHISSANNPSLLSPPCDIDMSRLEIGSARSSDTVLSKRSSIERPTNFIKPRPLISPSRFSPSSIGSSPSNLTKASWVAGGYWQRNNWPASNFTSSSPSNQPLTRSSSQSSGFGSIKSGFPSRSPPESRPESPLEEFDRLSVFSDNLEARSVESNFRYVDTMPTNDSYAHELTRKSLISTIPSVSGSIHPVSPIPPANQWSWPPFILGFSLALNLCFASYLFLHTAK